MVKSTSIRPTLTKAPKAFKVIAAIDDVYRSLWDKNKKMRWRTAKQRIKRILKDAGMSHDDCVKARLVKHDKTKHSSESLSR